MTYILGSRCSDGVVLVADRKFTFECRPNFLYEDKIISELQGIIIAFSADRGTFELFRTRLRTAVTGDPNMSKDEFIIVISEIMENLSKKYHCGKRQFDALVATGGVDRRAILRYFHNDGRFETITTVKALGRGNAYGSIFLDKLWLSTMNMEKVAELGTFIIKCIERFELDTAVGFGDTRPQFWFVPDLSDDDYEISNRERLWEQLDKATDNDINSFEGLLKDLLGGYRRKLA